MPISNFDGETFVAFTDISGFKELMNNGENALKALDSFYQYGYDTLQESNNNVEGFFISDKGVLFVRELQDKVEGLKVLLDVVKNLNEKMLNDNLMLTTSIAYGKFKYQERIEFSGIVKNPIYGNAYVSAFLDNKSRRPRIQPGQCRLVKENLPNEVESTILDNVGALDNSNDTLGMIKKRNGDSGHYYFYWMVEDYNDIERFEKDYKNSYNLKYAGMLKALKRG